MDDLPQARNRPRANAPIDVVGLGPLVTWVESLQIMLDKGRDLDWFFSPIIVILGLTARVSFAFFVSWEFTGRRIWSIDWRLFAGRNFSSAERLRFQS